MLILDSDFPYGERVLGQKVNILFARTGAYVAIEVLL